MLEEMGIIAYLMEEGPGIQKKQAQEFNTNKKRLGAIW